ncbi:AAA family ATPase [Streptomyces thermovulgaris]|uniref:AAA family ATPase n=1 Tax=Streptomyces thermovulgaris TaxID=1934 RepID=UPI000A3684DF|nr:AAA family ATPase [Streptomyces thermovulgaris]
MTAPLTPPQPPHRRPSQPFWSPGHPGQPGRPEQSGQSGQPGAAPNRQEPPAGAPAVRVYDQDGPGLRAELREAVVVLVAVTLGGVLLGLLWLWLAPRVPLVGIASEGNWAVYPKETEGEQAIGIDGTFTLLGLAFGAVSAVIVFLARRRGGVPLVVALCLGGLLGSLLAWRLGVALGPERDVIAHAKAVGEGVTFPAPLKLGAPGALLAWSLAALVVHLGLTALFGPRDPEPYEEPPAP